MKQNYIRAFAIFASILMLTIVAVPMVAAEDEYESCLDATEICGETHAEIKELFTELDIAIANYNQASKDGLPTYEYAEEIDAITKELAELGVEFELQRVIELEAVVESICPDEFEDLYEEINELLTELDTLILSHNEAYKAGNMGAVYEYGQEIDEIVQELGELGVHVEIEKNSLILLFILLVGGGAILGGAIGGAKYHVFIHVRGHDFCRKTFEIAIASGVISGLYVGARIFFKGKSAVIIIRRIINVI